TPTLLFFDEQGGVALRLNGYMPPERFRVALDYASKRLEKKQSFTEYLAASTPGKGGLAAQPFLARGAPELPRLLKAGKPVIVLFEQKVCRECQEMHRVGFKRPEVAKLLERFTVVQLDLAGTRKVVTPAGKATTERDWARASRVVYAPSLVFLDTAGKEVFRAEGYLKPFHLASALDYVAGGAYRREPNFQRFVQKRADDLRAAGHKVELWD
ncbi:MAG TPA: thioredoxin fold domain-containing protein, partial [Myxococcota bacterium]|nr:thioredoxin fold domain-containing protein [Myxococcota bacterium]